MKKDEEKISAALEQLVNQKPFEELTGEEKKSVLFEISEEEYRLLYITSIHASGVLKKQEVFPDAAVRNAVLASFDKRAIQQPIKKIFPLFSYSVPLYQAAAAVVLAILLLLGFHYFNLREDITNAKVIYVEKKDTVFIPMRSAITSQIDSNKNKPGVPRNNTLPVHEMVTKYTTGKDDLGDKERKKIELTRCRSIKMDSGLKQFMVSIE